MCCTKCSYYQSFSFHSCYVNILRYGVENILYRKIINKQLSFYNLIINNLKFSLCYSQSQMLIKSVSIISIEATQSKKKSIAFLLESSETSTYNSSLTDDATKDISTTTGDKGNALVTKLKGNVETELYSNFSSQDPINPDINGPVTGTLATKICTCGTLKPCVRTMGRICSQCKRQHCVYVH